VLPNDEASRAQLIESNAKNIGAKLQEIKAFNDELVKECKIGRILADFVASYEVGRPIGKSVILLTEINHPKTFKFARFHMTVKAGVDVILRFAMRRFKGFRHATDPPERVIASVELARAGVETDNMRHRIGVGVFSSSKISQRSFSVIK
jgi:hypothetical protein